ncbi:site-specific integrase [Microcoleus sp. F8-D3]
MRADKRPQPCDVSVTADGNSLRLGFPKRHTPIWEQLRGKSLKGKPHYLYLTKYGFKADNPEDWKRATQLAIALEADLDHPEWDKLFDPTLAKYGLGGGKYAKLADVLQLPGAKQPEPEITVGEMWEDYLLWKETQVEPTTFCASYKTTYTNIIKGLKWNNKTKSFDDTGLSIWQLPMSNECAEKIVNSPAYKVNVILTVRALNEAFIRASQLGKFNLPDVNPFFDLHKKVSDNPKDKYKSTITDDGEVIEWWQIQDANDDELEKDKRAFTKEERDIIIKAFHESDKANERQAAPLIEFLFLTGCRPGEAFALRWGDVMFDRGIIRFSKSYDGATKQTKRTKTKVVRMFPLNDKRLIDLLNRIKPEKVKLTDLIFKQLKGQSWNSRCHSIVWAGRSVTVDDKTYVYPGIVTRLADEGKISDYLPPYHPRHTYITLTAHACQSNSSALLLLAHACGNSPEVIMKHYLDVDRSVKLPEI